MNKDIWITPETNEVQFIANDSISACYDFWANLYCAIPGSDKNHVDDGSSTAWGSDGYQHGGPCTTNNTAYITGGTGKENSTGHTISNIQIGSSVDSLDAWVSSDIGSYTGELEAGYYKASWENYDDAGLRYKHYGIASIWDVIQIAGRPNHS